MHINILDFNSCGFRVEYYSTREEALPHAKPGSRPYAIDQQEPDGLSSVVVQEGDFKLIRTDPSAYTHAAILRHYQ